MNRCRYCTRLIWPWQRRGWRVGEGQWHTECYLKENPDAE